MYAVFFLKVNLTEVMLAPIELKTSMKRNYNQCRKDKGNLKIK
jgi:hypothetical protein